MRRFLYAALISWALAILTAFVGVANASLADDWAKGYREGTSFKQYESYQWVYDSTRDRDFVLLRQTQDEGVIIAEYLASWTSMQTDARQSEHGYVVFYLVDGEIYTEEHTPIHSTIDMAMAGQVADIASTGAGLAAGLSEANPIGGSPGGLVALMAIKLASPWIADQMSFRYCVEAREGLSAFGWGAAAWNLGMIAAGPALAIVGAIVAATQTGDRPGAIRACAVAKLDTETAVVLAAK